MNEFLQQVNGQERISYQSQIALWFYEMDKKENFELNYEQSYITEPLIDEFNRALNNPEFINKFRRFLEHNNECINYYLTRFNNEPWEMVKPTIWREHLNSRGQIRNMYRVEKLTKSHRFEILIDSNFKDAGVDIGLYYGREQQYNGECELGLEIKRDIKSGETTNIYIEYAEKDNANQAQWVNSGILKNDNTRYFVIGDFNRYWIISKEVLLRYYNLLLNSRYGKYEGCRFVEIGTSKGYLMPQSLADEVSISFDELVNML